MRKTMIHVWIVAALGVTLVSCGDDKKTEDKDKQTEEVPNNEEKKESDMLKIDMVGITGEINLPSNTKVIPGTDNTKEGEVTNYVVLQVGENSLYIDPHHRSLEEVKAELIKYNSQDNPEVVFLEEDSNYFFYSQRKKVYDGRGGEPSEKMGYSFYYVLNEGGKSYTIYAESEFFSPVWDEKEARDLFKIAQSFKPGK